MPSTINLKGDFTMKKFMVVMACIFGVLTIVLYFLSLNHLDSYSSRTLGTSTVVNIQGTVFCAACAIICALNIIGAMILHYLEYNSGSSNNLMYSDSSAGYSVHGIKTSDGGVQMTSGSYWTCPKCKNRNPLSKVECRECGTIRQ